MTAQFEEIVENPDLLDFQHLRPDVRQGLLKLRSRRLVVLALQLPDRKRRQLLAIELAVGIERHARQPQPVQRYHVVG
ncbi:hypothetical protein D3C80_1897020 [compost metagenome]